MHDTPLPGMGYAEGGAFLTYLDSFKHSPDHQIPLHHTVCLAYFYAQTLHTHTHHHTALLLHIMLRTKLIIHLFGTHLDVGL